MQYKAILAALVALASSASAAAITPRHEGYQHLYGDGSSWPGMQSWVHDFPTMFEQNMGLIQRSCGQYGQAPNSPQEIADLRSAIERQAAENGVDARLILAVVMQESKGCVRAPTSTGEFPNPGLMQSFMGTSCYGQVPCPYETINQMIKDGTAGTFVRGDPNLGLAGKLRMTASLGGSPATYMYRAAKVYNSGGDGSGALENVVWGTRAYCSDIANRLMGWTGDMSPF